MAIIQHKVSSVSALFRLQHVDARFGVTCTLLAVRHSSVEVSCVHVSVHITACLGT
jgi:hypothetical protein